MSFRAPKTTSKRRSPTKSPAKAATETPQVDTNANPDPISNITVHHHLVPAKDVRRPRRPPNIVYSHGNGGLWVEGRGQTFTQMPFQRRVERSQPYPQLPSSSSLYLDGPSTTPLDPDGPDPPTIFDTGEMDPFVDNTLQIDDDIEQPFTYNRVGVDDAEVRRVRRRRKREKQWSKWTQTTIPALIDHYLEYLRVSDSLRLPQRLSPGNTEACLCAKRTKLTTVCVFLDSA